MCTEPTPATKVFERNVNVQDAIVGRSDPADISTSKRNSTETFWANVCVSCRAVAGRSAVSNFSFGAGRKFRLAYPIKYGSPTLHSNTLEHSQHSESDIVERRYAEIGSFPFL